jgi:hypothetical protein
MAKFEVLIQHLPGGPEENHDTLVKIASFWTEMTLGPPQFEAGVLSI